MKTYNKIYYKAYHLSGNGWLDTWQDQQESVETVKKAIDEANERTVKNGWHAKQYIIARVVWERFLDDDGIFYHESRSITRQEIYPEAL